jgi:uncharacterized protein
MSMTSSARDPQSNTITELRPDECLTLLADTPIGRVAWTGPEGPQIIPMTIALHNGAVIFRTVAYSALGRVVDGATLAVEADEIDRGTRTGWSVLVVGRADTVPDSAELAELWRRGGPEPWAPGVRTLFVRVSPERVTGRRISGR